jgi:uncharacterized Zn-finger protein
MQSEMMQNGNEMLNTETRENEHYEAFKVFLSTAPVNWNQNESIRRFQLQTGETVSCILWNELFHITGTDIVRSLAYRFECLGRSIRLQKKFEEGIFSDLRNLKPLTDSTLEDSRSPFLKFLYENQCIRTQKKQKVFYWYSVKHDKLFLDALERDLKRESAGQPPCTVAKVPMGPNKFMELAKSQCMQPNAMPASISRKQETHLRASSAASNYSDHGMMFNHGHGLNHPQPRPYSPANQFRILHPGSPPQGMITPPTHSLANPQTQLMEEGYRIARNDSPMSHSMISNSPALSNTSASNLTYVDPTQNYGMTLSSMFNPAESMLPDRKYFQDQRQSPYPISMRPSSAIEKIYECPYTGCTRQFKRQEHLRRHHRSHTGERPHVCQIPECRRSFARTDHLQQHMRTHADPSEWKLNDIPGMMSPPQDFGISPIPYNFDIHRSDSRLSMMSAPEFHEYHDEPQNHQEYSNSGLQNQEYTSSGLNEQMESMMGDLLSLENGFEAKASGSY